MKQQQFEERFSPQWQRFQALLQILEGDPEKSSSAQLGAFPGLYRQLCQALAVARDRHYSTRLIERLGRLAHAGHQQLYGARGAVGARIGRFAAAGFPRLIRREAGLFWLAAALFYGPLVAMGTAVYLMPELVYSLLDPAQVRQIEDMYEPTGTKVVGRARDSDGDLLMFAFYIANNVAIGFQTFAGGLFLGLGTIFYLTFNGLYIGAVSGHLAQIGYGSTFYPFVLGHGAFELTAVVISGMAGFRIGLAVLSPGQQRRVDALRAAALISVRLASGAAALFVAAALIEAFWSSSVLIPATLKYAVGAAFWVAVALYLMLAGR